MPDELPEWQRPWTDAVGPTRRGPGALAPPDAEPVAVDRPLARHVTTEELLPAVDSSTDPATNGTATSGTPSGSVVSDRAVAEVAAPAVLPARTDADTGSAVDLTSEPRPRRRGTIMLAVGALLGSAVGTGVTYAVLDDGATPPVVAAQPVDAGAAQVPQITVVGPDGETTDGLPVVAAVAQAVTPSVVRVDIVGDDDNEQGLGSGVIYRSDGFIITNNHVVEDASSLTVRLADGDRLEAEVVGTDALNDLAVLRVEREDLPAIAIRENTPLVGEQAIAIGSPFGLDLSVTTGIISATSREIDVPDEASGRVTIFDVLQTDAAINPGNSGGALVDRQGQLVGINTAILTDSGGSQGVGFAIPVTTAVRNADQLISVGEVTYPFLGVTGRDLSPQLQEEFGLDNDRGALINSIEDGSGAAAAGMERGDIVVAVDGEDIVSMGDLVVAVRRAEVGDVLELVVLRDGDEVELSITLGQRPST